MCVPAPKMFSRFLKVCSADEDTCSLQRSRRCTNTGAVTYSSGPVSPAWFRSPHTLSRGSSGPSGGLGHACPRILTGSWFPHLSSSLPSGSISPALTRVSEAAGQLTGAWPRAHLSPTASPGQVRTALGGSGLWAAVSFHVWTLSHGFRRAPRSQALKPHATIFNREGQRGEGTLLPHFSLSSLRRMPFPVAPNKPPLPSLVGRGEQESVSG